MIPTLIAGYRPRETEAGTELASKESAIEKKKKEKEGNVIATKCRDNTTHRIPFNVFNASVLTTGPPQPPRWLLALFV